MLAKTVGCAGLVGVAGVLVMLASQSVASASTGGELAMVTAGPSGLGFAAATGVLVGLVVGRRRKAVELNAANEPGDSDAFSYPTGEMA